MAHDTKPAVRVGTITETPSESNGGFYVVDLDDGERLHLIGPGCPKRGQVGDRGAVTYSRTATGAAFAWAPLPVFANIVEDDGLHLDSHFTGKFSVCVGTACRGVSTDFAAAWIAEFGGRDA